MALCFVCVIGGLSVSFLPRLREYQAVDAEARRLETERDRLRLERERLTSQSELLNDRDYVELMARDRLSFSREGEIVYRFPEEGPGTMKRRP
jgi:cell division protein DivIC